MDAINLGGEGEIPSVVNQQGPWVVTDPRWRSSRDGKTFAVLVSEGLSFLICPNSEIALPNGSVNVVHTNGVPVDRTSTYGPGVQSSEIRRILKPGGEWHHDGELIWTKSQPPS